MGAVRLEGFGGWIESDLLVRMYKTIGIESLKRLLKQYFLWSKWAFAIKQQRPRSALLKSTLGRRQKLGV